jgi:hypothetical protein
MDPQSIDAASASVGGLLGAAILAAMQAILARLWPSRPAGPSGPASPAGPPLVIPVTPAPAPVPDQMIATIAAAAEAAAVAIVRSRILGGEPSPAMRAAGQVLRRLAEELDPPRALP